MHIIHAQEENPSVRQTLPKLKLCLESGHNWIVLAEQDLVETSDPPLLLSKGGRQTSRYRPQKAGWLRT